MLFKNLGKLEMMRLPSILIIICMFVLTSCFTAPNNGRLENQDNNSSGGNADGNGNGITDGDGSVGGDEENPIAKVEIRHLIEPKVDDSGDGGDHKRKLTIPKNYNGLLYVAGINVSTLADKKVDVRFNFGVNASPITVTATLSTAPGITPQTNVEVLVLDLRQKPFEDIELFYDLYDYNDYDFTGADDTVLDEPVNFNRDDKLFCRGLSLKDDSTFSGNLITGCVGATDTCKFSFVKVVDKGLITAGTPDVPILPGEYNIQKLTAGYYNDTDETKLDRCLPNNPILTAGSYIYDLSNTFASFESSRTINAKTYIFRGPYDAINYENWQIKGEALVGPYGVYGAVYDNNTDGFVDDNEVQYGYLSKLFPLYSKFDLDKDVQYMGSVIANGEKILSTMVANGDSYWMDGCNLRANSVHEITGEHIGSCNVTATIEILATDTETKKTTIIDITDEVKLQIVKPSDLNIDGDDVLLSSFLQCSSSSQCGSDSCCINSRCWSKGLVSQCVEDLPNFGNQETGDLCSSDYQCSSLCCNKIDGRCAPHDTISETPSYCSKPTGQTCVAKEWCQKHPVTTCAIVSTGTDPFGGVTCSKRCVTVEVFGECVSNDGLGTGQCKPPCQPAQPVFNPNDVNRCNDTMTFEQLQEIANNPTCG